MIKAELFGITFFSSINKTNTVHMRLCPVKRLTDACVVVDNAVLSAGLRIAG